jgi:hypothetical protein
MAMAAASCCENSKPGTIFNGDRTKYTKLCCSAEQKHSRVDD